MSLTSLGFLGFAALSIILLRILPGGGWRQATLLVSMRRFSIARPMPCFRCFR